MLDYGNARVAARRADLLGPAALRELANVRSPEELADRLARVRGWESCVASSAQAGQREGPTDAAGVVLAAIELHRSTSLSVLTRWYEPPARDLVEALVLPLDLERVVALLRLRVAGVDADTATTRVAPGALLDRRRLVELARAGIPADALGLLGRGGLLTRATATRLAALADGRAPWGVVEEALVAAWSAAREARTVGRGAEGAWVRDLLTEERTAARTVATELAEHGPEGAATLERRLTLARLDLLAGRARHDPLGIGVVAGYVAAVEAQAIRLRAVLSHVSGRWSRARAMAYLSGGG